MKWMTWGRQLAALSHPFFGWEDSPTKVDLILTSVLEDLSKHQTEIGVPHQSPGLALM